MIKLFILIISVTLWYLGGQKSNRIRDVGVPLLLGISLIFFLKGDWLHRIIFGILTAGSLNVIRIGYGNYSPEDDPNPSFLAKLTKDRKGYWIRLIWGGIVSILGVLPLVIGRYLSIPKYLLYICIVSLVSFLVSKLKLPVVPADLLVGSSVSSIMFLI